MSFLDLISGRAFRPGAADVSYPFSQRVAGSTVLFVHVGGVDASLATLTFDSQGRLASVTNKVNKRTVVSPAELIAEYKAGKDFDSVVVAASESINFELYRSAGGTFASDMARAETLRSEGGLEQVVGTKIATEQNRVYAPVSHSAHHSHLVFAFGGPRLQALESSAPNMTIAAVLHLGAVFVNALVRAKPDAFATHDCLIRDGDQLYFITGMPTGDWAMNIGDMCDTEATFFGSVDTFLTQRRNAGSPSAGSRPISFIDFGGQLPCPDSVTQLLQPVLDPATSMAGDDALRFALAHGVCATLDMRELLPARREVLPSSAKALPKLGLILASLALVGAFAFGFGAYKTNRQVAELTAQREEIDAQIQAVQGERKKQAALVESGTAYATWKLNDIPAPELLALVSEHLEGSKIEAFEMRADEGRPSFQLALEVSGQPTDTLNRQLTAIVGALDEKYGYRLTSSTQPAEGGKIRFAGQFIAK